MTQVQELARFVERTSYEGLSQEAIRELKVRSWTRWGAR
jgi:hypothetical protein